MMVLDINGILKHLPHRYPMLLVDRVEAGARQRGDRGAGRRGQ